MASNGEIIQYVPFTSFVHPSFWHALTDMKLEVDRLNETTKQIFGRFTYRDDIGTVFEVDGTSFNKEPTNEQLYENVTGTIMNKNTIEEFKNIDKAALLNSIGEAIWANIKKKTWITNPRALLNFIILSFADLKKFHYYYWFAFPSPSQPTVYLKETNSISLSFSNKQLEDIAQDYKKIDSNQKNFFFILKENDNAFIKPLSQLFNPKLEVQNDLNIDLSSLYFVFADPSNGNNPGWPLRTFLAALLEHCPSLCKRDIRVIGLRCSASGAVDKSLVFTVSVPENVQAVESAGWVGWERNDRGNFGPRLANMSASMDPIKLAETSSDLNIKLMKWRLVPDLDVDVMKQTKCLLLGAGTLGCHVARGLLAWGFRHITFVDYGKVSYSNPTRQVLFTHEDCRAGRGKADAAADNLRKILPSVETRGIALHIPMPGHPVGESLRAETAANIKTLTEAIQAHDVVFLLLDTREARWLPTLLGAHYGKIVLNAALGFDSYLVMRHGASSDPTLQSDAEQSPTEKSAGEQSHATYLAGAQLGCYFCNDVTAPGNSLKDRTLDQQCTVTRPGAAAVAGALAVELLAALTQHPLREHAPALYNLTDESDIPPHLQGVLGPIPHSIRGFLHSYRTVAPTCAKFKNCIACSDLVLEKYRTEGEDFVFKVLNSGSYLEEVTGLTELQLTAEMTDILTFSDEDEE
ncbi:ubiquitin-like modifier-activating enzyme ATG7 [Cydia splendana]|uniref:ubiquitin-like modifier-activating enzyme ATG7 n=1 Tax=Cydia splendana TaxID=1100963 RepID=UPI0028F47DED